MRRRWTQIRQHNPAFERVDEPQTSNEVLIKRPQLPRREHALRRRGFGREGIRYAMKEMTEVKSLILRLNG